MCYFVIVLKAALRDWIFHALIPKKWQRPKNKHISSCPIQILKTDLNL